jgi:hypothetical protein
LETERGSSGPQTLQLATVGDFFILSFLVPVRPGFLYTSEILSSAGADVGPIANLIPSDTLGHCHLVCSRRSIPPGAYKLRVKELDERRNPTDREFLFAFRVQE